MIAVSEVKQLSIEHGVPLPYVEKDYVMGWLLWAVYSNPDLNRNLILKGGNCLRKIYFPDTRFSDDLDFTALHLTAEEVLRSQFAEICRTVQQAAGIEFDLSRISVEEKSVPAEGRKAVDARVYFKGFAGDSSLTMRIKFDISDYEKIVLPLQHHPIIHDYSDKALLSNTKINSYSLEEVLAEKLRSWIQRTRARDLFDVVKIMQSNAIPISKKQILSTFLQKTLFKNIPMAGRDELVYENKFRTIEGNWNESIICPKNAFIVAANAITLFRQFIDALFALPNVEASGAPTSGFGAYGYSVRSGMRELLIQAGKARKLIRMRYSGKDRDIEPYSFRYHNGQEYFYGFDRTRGQKIKRFFLSSIQTASILPTQYVPRWGVEF